jgi:hypothetical protein
MAIRNDVLDRLVDQLSPEARELWEMIEHLAEHVPESQKRTPEGEMAPEHRDRLAEVAERSARLSERDQDLWDKLSAAKKQALGAEAERQSG